MAALLAPAVPAEWVAAMEPELLLRLALAAVLGGLVGLERELSGKPAGLRTNLLICIGAALFTELSLDLPAARGLRGDPARIAAQVVSGIGFLGAGTILHARGRVTGLTTAATTWVAAAIGMAVGAQAYGRAVGTTVIVLGALVFLRRIEAMRAHRRQRRRYAVELAPSADGLARAESLLRARGLSVSTHSVEKSDRRVCVVFVAAGPARAHDGVVQELAGLPAVQKVSRKR